MPTATTASVPTVAGPIEEVGTEERLPIDSGPAADVNAGAVVPVGAVPVPPMPVPPMPVPPMPALNPAVPADEAMLPVDESNLVGTIEEGIAAEIPDTDPDENEEEEMRAAMGGGFIYDDATLTELMNDIHGSQRVVIEAEKTLMIGNTVTVAGQLWSVRGDIEPEDIGIEYPNEEHEEFAELGLRSEAALPRRCRSNNEVNAGIRASPRNTPVKRVEPGENETIHNFFLTLFPVNWQTSLKRLNQEIENRNAEHRVRQQKMAIVTANEYWVFIGLLLLCGLSKTGGVEGLYKIKTQGILKSVNGAEYMSKRRFKAIKTKWVSQFSDPVQKVTNAWWMVARLVQGFNLNRSKTVASSRTKTLDESMSAYRPQTAKTGNLPNISFILRKPKNLGTELKTIATKGCNGAMIHAEIQEGKTWMKEKKYFRPYGATVACVLRMVEATKDCGQKGNSQITNLFYGDSWFAGLKTAVAVKELHQSEFVGIVKTSHRQFPKAYIEKEMKSWPSGTHLVLETTKNNNKYYAIGYKYSSKKIISFIASGLAGHTMKGDPYMAKWLDSNGRVAVREIPRPHLISQFFTHSNQIDKHNHARQSELAIEENVVTQDGYFRLFCTYLGITVTDTWKLYRHHLGDKHKNKSISIMDFSNILCKTLLVNDYKATGNETTTIPPLQPLQQPFSRQSLAFPQDITQNSQASISTLGTNGSPTHLIKIGEGKYIPSSFKARHEQAYSVPVCEKVNAGKGCYGEMRTKRKRCRLKSCGQSAGYYCSVCKQCICQPGHRSGRTCFTEHVQAEISNERRLYWESIQSTASADS